MTHSPKNFGIIWDMDGVLVNTAEAHYSAWKEILSKYGVDFSRKHFDDTFGINDRALIMEVLQPIPPDETIQEIANQKEILYRKSIEESLVVYPGAKEILKACRESGFKQALDSSAPQENIDAAMRISRLAQYFDAIISTDHLPSKEFPDAYLAASIALNIPPDHCLVIEDSILGITGAKKAGMACIGIASTHPADRLQKADLVISSIEELDLNKIRNSLGIQEGDHYV
jgi:HAD superfamily hydrolase (TIGR01509 family)